MITSLVCNSKNFRWTGNWCYRITCSSNSYWFIFIKQGRNYATPPTLIFEGGGGQGAQGAAEIDTLGEVTSISVVDQGEFYQEPPFILITGGGGIGAKAVATIDQGRITGINVTDPGQGYTSAPNIIFTKLVNLKRKSDARQSFNSSLIYLTGIVKDVAAATLKSSLIPLMHILVQAQLFLIPKLSVILLSLLVSFLV